MNRWIKTWSLTWTLIWVVDGLDQSNHTLGTLNQTSVLDQNVTTPRPRNPCLGANFVKCLEQIERQINATQKLMREANETLKPVKEIIGSASESNTLQVPLLTSPVPEKTLPQRWKSASLEPLASSPLPSDHLLRHDPAHRVKRSDPEEDQTLVEALAMSQDLDLVLDHLRQDPRIREVDVDHLGALLKQHRALMEKMETAYQESTNELLKNLNLLKYSKHVLESGRWQPYPKVPPFRREKRAVRTADEVDEDGFNVLDQVLSQFEEVNETTTTTPSILDNHLQFVQAKTSPTLMSKPTSRPATTSRLINNSSVTTLSKLSDTSVKPQIETIQGLVLKVVRVGKSNFTSGLLLDSNMKPVNASVSSAIDNEDKKIQIIPLAKRGLERPIEQTSSRPPEAQHGLWGLGLQSARVIDQPPPVRRPMNILPLPNHEPHLFDQLHLGSDQTYQNKDEQH